MDSPVRFLHTSDWHVGKAIRGRSRAEEHRAVLAEIAEIADREAVDAVLVGGDLYDVAAPTPEAEQTVWSALLDLTAERTRPVIVIAGNHDSPSRFQAVAPVFAAHGVHVAARPTRPDRGGVLELSTAGGDLRVALVPFPTQRAAASIDDLMDRRADQIAGTYADRVGGLLEALAAGFDTAAVNVVLAHLMVLGATLGGGERGAHTVFDYWVPATAFPPTAHYVALGHLHRAQRLEGPSPLRYCGSPLQLDFGETANEPSITVVTATPGRAGVDARAIELSAGRRLRSLRGTPEELLATDPDVAGDDHLRLVVDSGPRPGLADDLRGRFPNAVEVVLARREGVGPPPPPERAGRSPHELFAAYLAEQVVDDPRVLELFDELVEEATAP